MVEEWRHRGEAVRFVWENKSKEKREDRQRKARKEMGAGPGGKNSSGQKKGRLKKPLEFSVLQVSYRSRLDNKKRHQYAERSKKKKNIKNNSKNSTGIFNLDQGTDVVFIIIIIIIIFFFYKNI